MIKIRFLVIMPIFILKLYQYHKNNNDVKKMLHQQLLLIQFKLMPAEYGLKEFHKFDKKINFCNMFRELNSKTETDLEFFMLLKRNPLPKCTVSATSCHGIIFHISVSTSSFLFHSYFGRPFDLILIVSTVVEKLTEFYIVYFFFY